MIANMTGLAPWELAVEARPITERAFREAVANRKSADHTVPAIRRDAARWWVPYVGEADVADE